MRTGKGKLWAGLAVLAASSVLTVTAALAAEFVSISKDGVNLRSGPDTKFASLYELPAGYPLKVLEKKGEWLKVGDYENDQGWVFSPLVTKDQYVIVVVNEGNARSGPGAEFEKVGSVVKEVILKKVNQKGEWIQFEHAQLKGWIHKKLVWP
ncbi:MAG: SH3 domain-containing protein [Desulfobulbaceae bacterium]